MAECNQNITKSDEKSNTDSKNDDKLRKVNGRLNASYLRTFRYKIGNDKKKEDKE